LAIYVLKRIGLAIVTLWLLSVIIFFAGQVLPVTRAGILGNLASRARWQRWTTAGVDRPLVVQYGSWINGLLHGSMGVSYEYRTRSGRSSGRR